MIIKNNHFKKQIILSIIIVNYNTGKLLKDCLNSIFQKIKGINFEVWVIDNASSDKSLEIAKEELLKTKVVINKKNVGFAQANNQAMKKAEGKYIFLLNPDTVLLDENFKKLIEFMEKHPEAGACGPLVLNRDLTTQKQCKRGLPTFWNSLTYYSGLWKLFSRNKWWRKKFGGYFLLDQPEDKICEIDCLSGAVMLFRKEVIDKIGLLNEEYVMYWEDVEWCFRIKKANWKIYYVPLMEVMHYGGASGTQLHTLKNLWYFHKGAYLFYKKYLAQNYFFLINLSYYLGIWFAFLIKLITNLFKKEKVIGSKKP